MTGLEFFVANNPLWTYLIIFGGMFIEGDLVFLIGGIFALQGHLNWWWLVATVFAGMFLGDIVWYGLGRYVRNTRFGFFLIKRFRTYHDWLDKNFIPRYWLLAIFSKFIYYVNRLTPLAAGWHNFGFTKFLKIHFLAACIWVSLFGAMVFLAGYFVGPEGVRWLIRRLEFVTLGAIVIFIGGEYLLKRAFAKKISRYLS